ncbi:MAG: S-layer homology domain-containing protein [Bacillota bacterium]
MAGHPAEAIVAEAAEAGIVNGYPDGTFRPDTPVTRAEYIKLLVAAGRLRPGNCIGGTLFRDTGGHWLEAAGYLCTASWYGVVDEDDYPEDCLKPDEPITRLEMAVWT